MTADSPDDDQPIPEPLTGDQCAEQLNKLLQRHAGILSEYFNSVQIIATKLDEDGSTRQFAEGSGDYYARIGAVHTWVIRQDARNTSDLA